MNTLAQEIWNDTCPGFRPNYPWVVVRVLPKEQKRGDIILPDIDQNKTIHEGIVLATWRPFKRNIKPRIEPEAVERARALGSDWVLRHLSLEEQLTSDLVPGDHVIFPHWVGMNIEGTSEKHYRLIRERGWSETEGGGIIAKLEYDVDTRDVLNAIVHDSSFALMCTNIMDRFELVDKQRQCVTISGR